MNSNDTTISAVVNGRTHVLDAGTTVAGVLNAVGAPSTGVAVAVNGAVVPRTEWDHTIVSDGAVVEILTAVQGG